jgi:hypothetical protein
MTCWDARGYGICQTCGTKEYGHQIRELAIVFLRAMRWHYGSGQTIGGQQYEQLLCPACAKNEHRRIVIKPAIEQDALPIDWEALRPAPKSQGGHTR